MRREIFLKVSLVLNVLLAGTLGLQFLQKHDPAPPAGDPSSRSATAQPRPADQPANIPRLDANASPAELRRSLVDQLRAAGVPNRTLARVVQADLEEYWETRFEDGRRSNNPDTMAALQLEHDMTQDRDMRAALGEEGFRRWDQENMLREANIGKAKHSVAEGDAIYTFKKKLQESRWNLEQARLRKTMDDAEITDAADKAYNEFNRQMKSLLGEERYAKSQAVDQETVAENLRQDFAKANPSESQFQDILKTQRQWNDRRMEIEKQFRDSPTSPEYALQLRALEDERDSEYQRVLGPAVFDQLQKEQDGGYAKMKKYEGLWGLNDSAIDYVYSTTKFYEKSMQDYQAQASALEAQGQKVDWDVANRNLRKFAEQTQQSLKDYLGQDRFEKLQRNGVIQFDQAPRRGAIQ